MALEALFGPVLEKSDKSEVKTSELSKSGDGVLGIYFSAHWCPPCRGFTPQLAEVYNKLKADGKDFEIVFVSSDRDPAAFAEYHSGMPWLALPYANRDKKQELSDKYGVRGIPTLVLINAATGETISKEGRQLISKDGAAGFPYKG